MNLRINTDEEAFAVVFGLALVMNHAEDLAAWSFEKAHGLNNLFPAQPLYHGDMRRHLLEFRSAHNVRQRLLRSKAKRR